MRIFAGGYGIQGFLLVPLIDVLEDLGVDYQLVVNGLGGFYAVAREKLGKEEALKRLKGFVRRFWEELRVSDRAGMCQESRRRWNKTLAIKYCYIWSVRESSRDWKDLEDLLDGIEGETEIGTEYFDLRESVVGVRTGDAREVASISVALLGLFPPYGGRYVSTTYLTQIPVLSASKGDVVLGNLRDPSGCDVRKGDEILAQAAEIRALTLARKVMERKSLRVIEVGPMSWSDIGNVDRFRKTIRDGLEEVV